MFPFWKWLFFQHLKNPKGIWNFDGFWTVKKSKTDPKTFLIFLNYCNHRVRKTQRHLQFTKKFSLFKKLKRPQKTSANLLGNSRKGTPLSGSKEAQMTQRTLACTFLEMALSFGRERERRYISFESSSSSFWQSVRSVQSYAVSLRSESLGCQWAGPIWGAPGPIRFERAKPESDPTKWWRI